MDPSEWRERVGRQIEAARNARGIKSMREAARQARFSEATWRQLESGRRQLAPGHVVAPTPKASTLVAAAQVVGLDPVQLVVDAGGSSDDVAYAEDYEAVRLAEREGADGRHRTLDERLGTVWVDLSHEGKESVVTYATELRNAEAQELLAGVRDVLVSSGGDPNIEIYERATGVKFMPLRVAANEGSRDPHDDLVGPPKVRHPGGADPEPGPGD